MAAKHPYVVTAQVESILWAESEGDALAEQGSALEAIGARVTTSAAIAMRPRICQTCNGTGDHYGRSLSEHDFLRQEFIPCSDCGGLGKVWVLAQAKAAD